ncbi:hypothetical protein KCP74_24775 [Salmonella enterica subsp. enterica]|nr:hypothetical protein KCP74_24775 [Salmonella enterica subsp. enterica]
MRASREQPGGAAHRPVFVAASPRTTLELALHSSVKVAPGSQAAIPIGVRPVSRRWRLHLRRKPYTATV